MDWAISDPEFHFTINIRKLLGGGGGGGGGGGCINWWDTFVVHFEVHSKVCLINETDVDQLIGHWVKANSYAIFVLIIRNGWMHLCHELKTIFIISVTQQQTGQTAVLFSCYIRSGFGPEADEWEALEQTRFTKWWLNNDWRPSAVWHKKNPELTMVCRN